MQFSGKQLAIVALVVILAVTNIALAAVVYMTKNVNISGGILVVGAIEVYDTDGVTPLTSYDFPLFTGGVFACFTKQIFINNTGNQPVYVYWNISSSSIAWTANEYGYNHWIDGTSMVFFGIETSWSPSTPDAWIPNDYSTPEALYLGVDEGRKLQMQLLYPAKIVTAITFTLVMSFYAQDA